MKWRVLTAALLLLGAGAARAAEPPSTPSPPAGIPIAEIVTSAEQVRARLDATREALAGDTVLARLSDRLAALRERVQVQLDQTRLALDADPTPARLDQLAAVWATLDEELAPAGQLLQDRATRLEEELRQLDELKATWEATGSEARAASAPPEVVARIDASLTAIGDLWRRVEQRRDRILVLQDLAARQRAKVADMARRIAETRLRDARKVLAPDRPPIWRQAPDHERWRDAALDLRASLRNEGQIAREHLRLHWDARLLQVALLVALAWALRSARENLRRGRSDDPRLAPVLRVLEVPYSCAVILTLLLSRPFSPTEGQLLTELGRVVVLIPIVRVLGRLLDPTLMPIVYGLAAASFLERVRGVMAAAALFERWIFQLELTGLLVWFAALYVRRRRDPVTARVESWQARLAGPITVVLLAVAALAFVSAAIGYARLARFIDMGVIGSTFLALQLLVVVQVLGAVTAYVLASRPLRLSTVVQLHRWAIHRRLVQVFAFTALLGWAASVLASVGLLTSATDSIRAVLGARFEQGDLSISLGDLLFLVVAVWLAIVVAGGVAALLEEDVLPRTQLPRGVPAALASFAHVTLIALGFVLALAGVGIDLSKLAIFAGALGVGVGFGLQNVVNNFVSGIILLFERPVQVGDYVRIGGVDGEMRQIGVRSSVMRTADGAEMIVPNATLIASEVTNWTRSDRLRRIDVPVRVAYGTLPTKMLELLLTVAEAHPAVAKYPAPVALFEGFGDSALNFQLQAWTDRVEQLGTTRSELAVAIEAGLRERGIEIPFPQRDVRLRS